MRFLGALYWDFLFKFGGYMELPLIEERKVYLCEQDKIA